jgi:hypothetical protein
MDSLTHFFANNIILTFVVIVVIGMLVTRGIGGGFFARILFVLIFAYIVLVMMVSFIQSIDAGWTRFKGDVIGFLKDRACSKLPGEVCTFSDLAQAKQKSIDDHMLCFEKVLAADANNGGAAVKQACGPRYDAAQWETCVNQQAARYQYLADDLTAKCPPVVTPGFMHDLIEGFACPLGITSWCQTSSSSKQQANQPGAYVYDARYSTCLNDAAVRLQEGTGKPVWSKTCYDMPDGQGKDACFIGQIQNNLPPANAKEWLDYCNSQRTPR